MVKNSSSESLPAFIPTAYLSDAKLRINAYREIAEANTPKSISLLEKNWIDRQGRLPEAVQRLILHRNGSPILLDGSRFPRLLKSKPAEKLEEALEMLQNF